MAQVQRGGVRGAGPEGAETGEAAAVGCALDVDALGQQAVEQWVVAAGEPERVAGPGEDAALFSFTHDVLRSPVAVERVAAALRPGGRAVAAGSMDPWLPPHVTTLEGLDQPWSHLAERLKTGRVERPSSYLGSMYVVTASKAS